MIVGFVRMVFLLLVAMTVHEFAHALMAYLLGDRTAQDSGRLTLNPLAHIDPVGTLAVPAILYLIPPHRIFAWAKPVPIDFRRFKNPQRDILLVGASGPVANLLFAVLLSGMLALIPLPHLFSVLFVNLIELNVVLGVFNLIPIPPLDGSRVLFGLLPTDAGIRYMSLERFGMFIILGLAMTNVLGLFVWPISDFILRILGVTA